MQHKNFKTLIDVYIEYILGHSDCDNYYTEDMYSLLNDEKDINSRIKEHKDNIKEYKNAIKSYNNKINSFSLKLKYIFFIVFFITMSGYYFLSDKEITLIGVAFISLIFILQFSSSLKNYVIAKFSNENQYKAYINESEKNIKLCREELLELNTDLIFQLWADTPSEKLDELRALIHKHRYNVGYD